MDRGQWSQELPGRPRGMATAQNSHDRHGDGRRSMDHSNSMMAGAVSHHHSSQRGMASRKPREQEVPLEEGIQDLFEHVNKAMGFCTHFAQEYQQDIQRISRYCEKYLLDEIWMRKAQGSPQDGRNGHSGRRRGEHQHDMDREELVQSPSLSRSLTQLIREIESNFRAAEAYRPSQRGPSRYQPDDLDMIRRKLRLASSGLKDCYQKALQRSSGMENVTTELEILRVFLERKGAGGGADRGAKGGRHPGGRRGMEQDEEGGQNAFGDRPDEPEEEWNGGQEPGQGVAASDAGGGGGGGGGW